MPRRRLANLLLGLLLPAILWAQIAPRTQPKPTVPEPQKSQEKKPADDSQEPFVFEQLQTRVRFEADGTSRQESLAVLKVQSETGAQQLSRQEIGYNSANQKVQVEYVRVRKANGGEMTVGASAVRDTDSPLAKEAPAYADYRRKSFSVPGLGPGDTLEYKIVTLTETPPAPGNFWFAYEFEKSAIVLDERLEIDVPKSREVRLKTRADVQPKVTEQGERKIYSWTSKNIERQAEEEKEALKSPAVQLTTFTSWAEVGRWYASLEKERIAPTDEIRAKATQILEGHVAPLEKIEALYEYVAKNFRDVGLPFGTGRYEPHPAGEVLANGYADSKDKHTLLASLLEATGFRAETVLAASQRNLDDEVPSPTQLDHVLTLARISARGNERNETSAAIEVWMDTSMGVAPFRMLPANLRGKKALLVAREAAPGLIETPQDPPFPSTQLVEIDGRLNEAGKLTARVKFTLRGDAELTLRTAFHRTPREQWKQLAQWSAISDGFRGTVTDVKVNDPLETREAFQFEYAIEQAGFVDWSNKKSQTGLPLPSMGLPALPDEKDGAAKIELGTPLDAVTRLTLELPATFTARMPIATAVTRDYADYRSSYRVQKNILRAERVLNFKLRELPAERSGDYRAFVRAIRNDEGQTLLVNPPVPKPKETKPPARSSSTLLE